MLVFKMPLFLFEVPYSGFTLLWQFHESQVLQQFLKYGYRVVLSWIDCYEFVMILLE